jgi:hypothetical protein
MSKTPLATAESAEGQSNANIIRLELERLFNSDQFKNSKRCQTLLSFIVEETIAGRGAQLKERLVGVNVYRRDPDYDTAEDPVVRNAAIEVRKRLAQYYAKSGKDAAIRIDLHAGNYIPEFHVAPPAPEIPETQLPLPARPPRRRVALGIVASAVLLGIGLGALLLYFRVTDKSGFESVQSHSLNSAGMAAPPLPPATATTVDPVRILAGYLQPANYIDRFGNQWLSDRYFTGGEPRVGSTNFFFPPADPELFRTSREGSFTYDIPLRQKQVYEMRLYFVEPQYRYGNEVGGDGENQRVFEVSANGQPLLNNFDVITDAGFGSTTIRAFRDIVPAQDGELHLRFIAIRDQPLVSAIELLPATAQAIPPIQIHAAPFFYTDQAGNRWGPDNFYIGGELFAAGAPVTGTDDADLYKVARMGNFHYAIPVPPGRYSLTLYFAETWFHNPGERVFDVSCNGVMLIHRLDILQEAGFSHILKKTFHGLEPNGQGKLLISFSPIVNYANVRALEVVDEAP